MSDVEKLWGIDLGTTYSCISYLDGDHPVVCPSKDNNNTTFPSVVRYLPDDPENGVVGATAKDSSVLYSDYTIQFVKSKIGRMDTFEYGPEDDRKSISPVKVSADILRKLVEDAGEYTNTEVRKVVITVPAYFGQNEKEATRRAGEEAGLEVLDIIEEPTAAALFYGLNNIDENKTICVFDLGGGTFDVTVLTIKDRNFKVETTDGNHDLGGRNWDEVMKDLLKEKFCEVTGFDGEFDEDFEQELQIKSETAKFTLTNADKAQVALKLDKDHKANIEITREEFESATSYLLESAMDLTKNVIERVKERGIVLDKILLVGGSTFMPQVKKALVEVTGMEPELNEPNLSVSKGAAIWAGLRYVALIEDPPIPGPGEDVPVLPPKDDGIVGGLGPMITGGNITVKAVANKSFGIRALVGKEKKEMIKNLILKDQTLPIEITKTFGTSEENMTNVSLAIYQSERYEESIELDDGVQIGDGVLEGLPAGLPENEPIKLTIKMKENGLLTITGSHNGTPLIGNFEESYSQFTKEVTRY